MTDNNDRLWLENLNLREQIAYLKGCLRDAHRREDKMKTDMKKWKHRIHGTTSFLVGSGTIISRKPLRDSDSVIVAQDIYGNFTVRSKEEFFGIHEQVEVTLQRETNEG